jgi:hypothetical protein
MKTYLRFACSILVVSLFAAFQGCGGGYSQFYRSTTGTTYSPISNAQAYQYTPDTLNHILRSGYEVIGEANFNGPYEGLDAAIFQANMMGADIVLLNIKHTGAQQTVVPIPQYHPPVTTRESGNVQVYGPSGYYGSGTYTGTTTYPGYTSYQYMPLTVQRYDHNALFLRKKPTPQTVSVPSTTQRYGPPPDSGQIVGRDREYIAYENGIVQDTATGLEWMVGPDKNMTWDEAKAWIESLNSGGNGWRMPTIIELRGLYEEGRGDRNMTPLLKTSGWWVWFGETWGSSVPWGYRFYGSEVWLNRSSGNDRAFAVRSSSSGELL